MEIFTWLSTRGPMFTDNLFSTFSGMKVLDEQTYEETLMKFVDCLGYLVSDGTNFDLSSIYLHFLLKYCHEDLVKPQIAIKFDSIINNFKKQSVRIEKLMNENICALKFLKSDRI